MKKIIVATVTVGFSVFSHAQSVNVQALEVCTLIDNDFKRLHCFDKVMANQPISHSDLKQVPANSSQQAQHHTAPTSAVQRNDTTKDFGLENRSDKTEALDSLVATISMLKDNGRGTHTFTLDNGQIWKQIGSDRFPASKGDKVEINRASFGSFLMNKVGANRSIRVKRVN
ncbi:hypothetical protein ACSLBF_00710 [Pseudoalteromonas sp. T1lg65]|uniref:hypothetical protein n=1 Tax=Pseudoalteromonas sp. T1lg65 TaxID=2077101 RepID=UPI003F792AF4